MFRYECPICRAMATAYSIYFIGLIQQRIYCRMSSDSDQSVAAVLGIKGATIRIRGGAGSFLEIIIFVK